MEDYKKILQKFYDLGYKHGFEMGKKTEELTKLMEEIKVLQGETPPLITEI